MFTTTYNTNVKHCLKMWVNLRAKAGVQSAIALRHWMPAFAGMTGTFYFIGPKQ